VKQASDHNIMVGRHPSVPDYLFKKYNSDVSFGDQRKNYENRVKGADKIRQLIEARQLRHIVVPHKWIYALPSKFSSRKKHKPSYVLIVERMDILDMQENAARYQSISEEVLEELCRVLYRFRGFDSAPHNLRFTAGGQIAFIDTESWNRSKRSKLFGVFRRLDAVLTASSQKLARQTLKKLADE